MKILFICKFNRFRSKAAEALFNKLNKNPKHTAKSAGAIRGRPISKEIFEVAKDLGLKISRKPRGLTAELLAWNDCIVIVADNVPRSLFEENEKHGKKLEAWGIKDTTCDNKILMQKTIKQIELRVRDLLKRIK